MSEDAPVNTGAASWPDLYSAGIAVRRMQTKLHLWAARDPNAMDLSVFAGLGTVVRAAACGDGA